MREVFRIEGSVSVALVHHGAGGDPPQGDTPGYCDTTTPRISPKNVFSKNGGLPQHCKKHTAHYVNSAQRSNHGQYGGG